MQNKHRVGQKGISHLALVIIGLVVGATVYGALAVGSGSFWYNVNNPNTSVCSSATQANNCTALSTTAPIATFQSTLIPLAVGIVVFLVFVRTIRYKK